MGAITRTIIPANPGFFLVKPVRGVPTGAVPCDYISSVREEPIVARLIESGSERNGVDAFHLTPITGRAGHQVFDRDGDYHAIRHPSGEYVNDFGKHFSSHGGLIDRWREMTAEEE
jgi:hypothetical protein